jgi:hypothetical protein
LAGINQRHLTEPSSPGIVVAQRSEFDAHAVAGLERSSAPSTGPLQVRGAGRFDQPHRCRLALFDDAVEDEVHMRVGPSQFHHRSIKDHDPGFVEHCGGVMRRRRLDDGSAGSQEAANAGDSRIVDSVHELLSSFRGHEVAALVMRDRDESRIAVLVEAVDEALLQAIAFDEFEFAFALAEKDSRRLPRTGQNPRRDDFQVVVEKTRALQVDALDDVHVAVVGHANGFADREVGLR